MPIVMNIIQTLIDLILHLDTYLIQIIDTFGPASYIILFLVIFCETGLVFLPFLPGDSLMFAAGALSAVGAFNIYILFLLLCLAAILGDSLNYWVGSMIGVRVFHERSRFFKKEYLERTHKFFEKHGAKTIILARFIPIIRTFAPFLAGVGKMSYWKFLSYNIFGGIAWVCIFLFSGYFFGNIQFVKDNFSLAVLLIIIVSTLPLVFEFVRHKIKKARNISTEKAAAENIVIENEK
jgi:membrane-associated protein